MSIRLGRVGIIACGIRRVRGTARRVLGLLLCIPFILGLPGCHGDVPPGPQLPRRWPPAPPPVPVPAWLGYFTGTVTIGDPHDAKALLTDDGAVRIHINKLWGDPLNPTGSAQFIGRFETVEDQGLGSGLVVGQECAIFPAGRFCTETAPAELSITTATRSLLAGELLVAIGDGEETWPFEMALYFDTSGTANVRNVEGLYREELAEFATRGDVIISVDSGGQLFFQGPSSGCTGNGTLRPHGEVYDAMVTIESCNEQYASLNGDYEGLGVHIYPYYDWEAELLLWLSTPEEAASRAALTMWGTSE